MDRAKLARWMTDFYRVAWDNTMVMIKQCRQGISDPAKGSPWTKEESRKFIGKWIRTHRKGYDDYREEPGERYRKYIALFGLRKRIDSANADQDRNLN